jgi:hypothetical protein
MTTVDSSKWLTNQGLSHHSALKYAVISKQWDDNLYSTQSDNLICP